VSDFYFDFKQTGKLTIEKVLFSSYQPVLFTCRSDKGNLFLCVCCGNDNGFHKWLLSETGPATVLEMLEDEITLRCAFLKDNKGRYTISRDKDGNESISCNDSTDWHAEDSFLLPTAGEYLDADEGEFSEEIRFYRMKQVQESRLRTIKHDSAPLPIGINKEYQPQSFNIISAQRLGYGDENIFVTHKGKTRHVSNIPFTPTVKPVRYDNFSGLRTGSYNNNTQELSAMRPLAS